MKRAEEPWKHSLLTHPAALSSKASGLPGFWRRGIKAHSRPHSSAFWSLISGDRAQASGPSKARGFTHLGEVQVASPMRQDAQSCSAIYCPLGRRPPRRLALIEILLNPSGLKRSKGFLLGPLPQFPPPPGFCRWLTEHRMFPYLMDSDHIILLLRNI